MEPQRDKLNMRQVAALAGVSHQTVSRVLNDHPSIRPATRDRVLRVMKEVNYRPNSAARALATNKSQRIGVLLDSAVEYGPNSTLRAIEQAARAQGYSVASVTLGGVGEDLDPGHAVDHLLSQGVDGLCVIAPRSSSLDLVREATSDVPTLVVKASSDETFLTASVDQELGAALAVRHLIELGHRTIVHVAGPLDWLDAQGRRRGWASELDAAGLEPPELVVGDWTADYAYRLASTPGALPPCTAIFAGNDQMALGLIHGLTERGLSVPGDVSVVGFDDLPEAKHFLPPLTTVRQDFQALGERAVQLLLAELSGEDPGERAIIVPELMVRSSAAPPHRD